LTGKKGLFSCMQALFLRQTAFVALATPIQALDGLIPQQVHASAYSVKLL
jgi:hypothetical protein